MLISYNNLKSLPVYTKSNTYLGKVSDLVIDIDSHFVLKYETKPRVSRKKYLISRDQILEITSEKIIVADAVLTEIVRVQGFKEVVKNTSPVLTSGNQ